MTKELALSESRAAVREVRQAAARLNMAGQHVLSMKAAALAALMEAELANPRRAIDERRST